MSNYYDQNRNARINTRVDEAGNFTTATVDRDVGSVVMSVSTNKKNNSTNLSIDFPVPKRTTRRLGENNIELSGRQARSLYRLLRKHYGKTGKSRTA